jgi:hypothetical protein
LIVDLPQGLPKKIEFDLLLADLALQLGNAPPGRRKRFARPVRRRLDHRRRRRAACRPRRPAAPAQGLRTTRQKAVAAKRKDPCATA